ncbi:TPA: hypothetical protein PXO92_004666 [Yersinia enterocolitica]|nr:hypothetical protein [Yersinia enterocolitica]
MFLGDEAHFDKENVMISALTFRNHEVIPFNNGDGKIWFTSEQLANLLEYTDSKKVANLYNRHKDEFTECMSTVAKLRIGKENNELQCIQMRIFSVRGAHLIGMLSRTKVAKALRRWLLDLADKEQEPNLAYLDLPQMKDMTIEEMQNRVTAANKWSLENFGRAGSQMMNLRRLHLKKIRKAEKALLEMSQIQIPDLGEFAVGESA